MIRICRPLAIQFLICVLAAAAAAKTNTTTTLSSSLNPSTYGASVTFTATVSPSAATGTVTFKNGSTTLGTGTLSGGKATYMTSTLTTGTHSITASYGGNSTYNSSTSSALSQTVNKATSSTALASSANPSIYQSSVTFTATVTPSAATGTVTFKNGTATLGTGTLSGGKATYSTSSLSVGSHSITASYGGDSNDTSSTSSTLTQNVLQSSSTALGSSPNPSVYGASVTFTATVSPSAATGTVTFYNSATALGTSSLTSGVATYSTSTLPSGSDSIKAVYSGSSTYASSTSSVLTQSVLTLTSISVTPATVTLPIAATQQFTATGTYSNGTQGNITSSVTWSSSATTVATISAAGVSTGTGEGAATIQASVGSINGSATLTGTPSAFRFTGSLNYARDTFTATVLQNGNVLIAGGTGYGSALVATCELYNPTTGAFSDTGNLNVPRFGQTATLLNNGTVLIAGGLVWDSSEGVFTQTATAELYNPSTGTFSLTGSMAQALEGHTATLLGSGMVLIAGGEGLSGYPATAELYTPATLTSGTFSNTGNLNTPRSSHTATLLNDGTVLIAGGEAYSGGVLTLYSSAEIYNPTSGAFNPTTGSMNVASSGHSATLLSTGRVLIAAGSGNSTGSIALARTELYNPSSQTFTLSGSLTTGRQLFSATLLSNGQVLFAGGISPTQTIGTGELYNPTSGTTSIAGNLNVPRAYHSAAALNNGLVLIVAGIGEDELDSAETYDWTIAQPPPFTLQITPAVVNMIVGATQQFTAVDNQGIPRTDATWSVSNSSLATVTTNGNGTGVLTAVAAGQVTLTATADGVSAQEQVTILSASSYPVGTAIWSASPPAGFSVTQLAQAVPSAGGPDLYSISTNSGGTQSTIQALQADGEQLWQTTMPALLNNSVPDGFGGLIVTYCPSGSPLTVMDLDSTGQPVWQVQSAEVSGYGYICYPPQIAIDGNGVAYIAEPTNAGLPSVTIAYPNTYITSLQFQPSVVNNTDINCCVGPPIVNTDGNLYVEYEVRTTTNNVITSDTLYLYIGGYGSIMLGSTTQNEALLPGPIIPDGNGGVLATWTISPAQGELPQYPFQIVDVNNYVVGTPYSLPFSPATVVFGQSPTLVLGENGIGFVTDGVNTNNGPSVVSFNVSSGSTNLLYQAAAGDTLSIIEATSDGGVTISDANAGGVVQVAGTGNGPGTSRIHRNRTTPASSSLLGAVPYDLGSWVSIATGAVTSLWSPTGTNGVPTILAQSTYPMPHGNTHSQNVTPYCQMAKVNCALAPNADLQTYWVGKQVRQVSYWLFSLQNATLTPLVGTSQIQGVKIEEWEANASNPNINSCSWQNQDTICQSPMGDDPPGQITDDMGAGISAPYTISQQFLVDRQGVQVFWPNSVPKWYGAWGTPASSPQGFQPNQTASVVTGWATITQINVNNNAPATCSSQCDTDTPQQGPPQ